MEPERPTEQEWLDGGEIGEYPINYVRLDREDDEFHWVFVLIGERWAWSACPLKDWRLPVDNGGNVIRDGYLNATVRGALPPGI